MIAIIDYNLLTPEDIDELIFNRYQLALGKETRDRMRKQLENYAYYEGYQHENEYGELVKASELEFYGDLDYEPTRYATNYFKAIIDRKARWQMGGEHGIHVPRKDIDPPLDQADENYEPSPEQKRADEIAEKHEELLYRLWDENKMRSKLLQAARDRLIANRVVCKIIFDRRTGRLRWVWRPDYEFIPVFSEDDFEDLIACHFVRHKKERYKDAEVDAVQVQSFELNEERDECFYEEAIYRTEDLKRLRTISEKAPMGLDFIPVVMFPVSELLAEEGVGDGEIGNIREQNDILNQMNEDAIDSLKFEMFSMMVAVDVPEGTADKIRKAPGAIVEVRGSSEGARPDFKSVESGFRWKEAFKDQYNRVKSSMHEISSLPQIVPQELNFGGLNTETLQILFKDIIADTEEHWLIWGYQLAELHEKSIRYLQARLDQPNFAYDKEVVRAIEDYKSEIKFVLPLPDNRKELVELIGDEIALGLESQSGGMERLGVENVTAKKAEIAKEQSHQIGLRDPYSVSANGDDNASLEIGDTDGIKDSREETTPPGISENEIWTNEDGEPVTVCYTCDGSGKIRSPRTDRLITCPTCRGDGIVQLRQR